MNKSQDCQSQCWAPTPHLLMSVLGLDLASLVMLCPAVLAYSIFPVIVPVIEREIISFFEKRLTGYLIKYSNS